MRVASRLFDAWAAGFIDGEGSFAIHPAGDPRRAKHGISHQPRIYVANTCKEPLARLQHEYGGNVTFRASVSPRRDIWMWQLTSHRGLVPVIPRLLPFLTVKRPHAELMQRYLNGPGLPRPGRRPLSDEVFEQRVQAFEEMRALNKRGV